MSTIRSRWLSGLREVGRSSAVHGSRWARRIVGMRQAPPVVGLVLSGGGASASFQVGAVRYLYDTVGITPSVITGTSAGSILAALLAQADDHCGQRSILADIERMHQSLRTPSDMMVPLDWFAELQKLTPALQRMGGTRHQRLEPRTITLPTLGLRRQRHPSSHPQTGSRQTGGTAETGGTDAPGGDEQGGVEQGGGEQHKPGRRQPATAGVIRLPRWDATPVRETLSILWSVTRSRPDFEALLRGAHQERSMFRRGPIFDQLLDPDVFDPARLARSSTELRIAVVGLESGELRYVTGTGAMVDRDNQPLSGHPPVLVADAVHASCAIPAVYPPVRLGDEHYVDGGTRENSPVEVAMRHLGVNRCYAVISLPKGLPTESSHADKDMLAIVLRATAGIMADEVQLDDVARARAAGAVVIIPEVNLLGVLDVDPGLMAIATDYGYLRAAEACTAATPEQQQVSRDVVELRRVIWSLENEIFDPHPGSDAAPADRSPQLAALKAELRALVEQIPADRRPEDALLWWRRYEGHSFEITPPPSW